MRTGKKEEMNQLEKVKNTTVKNQNIMLKKELAFLHPDKLIEVIQWDYLPILKKNF